MTCGDHDEERLHDVTMAASYWLQQYKRLEVAIDECGNQLDLEALQRKVKSGVMF